MPRFTHARRFCGCADVWKLVELTGFDNLFDSATISAAVSTLLKVGLAGFLGALIGIERELSRRPAGVRTHMLVCLGCALFTEISQAFVSPNPDRVAAQVVTGIGFLGAGTILRTGLEVKGLTTAASIWAVAAIGMACSMGGAFLWVAIVFTLLTLGTLAIVAKFEIASVEAVLTLRVESREVMGSLLAVLESSGETAKRVEIWPAEKGYSVSMTLRDRSQALLDAAVQADGVLSAEWAD